MALLTVEEYIERRYAPNSRPPKHRIWRNIRLGRIPRELVIKEGKYYYIDEKALQLTGNPMVDKVLCS